MHGNRIAKEDIVDADFVDALELRSDGTASYFTLPLISISAGGVFTVDISGLLRGIISEPDGTIEAEDRVFVTGASPGSADGYYTIADLITESTFDVLESTVAATGGTILFLYASGAGKVGFDSSELDNTTADNVQDAIKEIDFAVTGGGINANVHKTLRQLIHLADGVGGPWESFTSGAFREILPASDPFPTSVTWYESSSKLKKIVEKTIVRNSNKTPSTIEWTAYDTDGTTPVATIKDTITYDGVFELDRTREILLEV
jgi:hypothetical protein